jgi:hypothetical protein
MYTKTVNEAPIGSHYRRIESWGYFQSMTLQNGDPAISDMLKKRITWKWFHIHKNCQRSTKRKPPSPNRTSMSFPLHEGPEWPKLRSSPFRYVKADRHRRSGARHEQFEPTAYRKSTERIEWRCFMAIGSVSKPKLRWQSYALTNDLLCESYSVDSHIMVVGMYGMCICSFEFVFVWTRRNPHTVD